MQRTETKPDYLEELIDLRQSIDDYFSVQDAEIAAKFWHWDYPYQAPNIFSRAEDAYVRNVCGELNRDEKIGCGFAMAIGTIVGGAIFGSTLWYLLQCMHARDETLYLYDHTYIGNNTCSSYPYNSNNQCSLPDYINSTALDLCKDLCLDQHNAYTNLGWMKVVVWPVSLIGLASGVGVINGLAWSGLKLMSTCSNMLSMCGYAVKKCCAGKGVFESQSIGNFSDATQTAAKKLFANREFAGYSIKNTVRGMREKAKEVRAHISEGIKALQKSAAKDKCVGIAVESPGASGHSLFARPRSRSSSVSLSSAAQGASRYDSFADGTKEPLLELGKTIVR